MLYSIVIPTHNRPQMLRRAVASALSASTGDAEVLVVDDASRQPAAMILSDISDPRLRLLTNDQGRGAAAARNCGVAAAEGEAIFFLDDDDELVPGYCDRILSGPAKRAASVWGFSSIRLGDVGTGSRDTAAVGHRRRWTKGGTIPASAPLRAKIGGAGAGFWIRRDVFLGQGGFDPALAVDEDTDLCVRLVMAGHLPWFEQDPGTIVYHDYTPRTGEQVPLTSPSEGARAASSYLRTYIKAEPKLPPLSEARWFLAKRYIRRSVKAGLADEARTFCQGRKPFLFKLALSAYLSLKTLSRRLKAG